jgi:hypothetical protein
MFSSELCKLRALITPWRVLSSILLTYIGLRDTDMVMPSGFLFAIPGTSALAASVI